MPQITTVQFKRLLDYRFDAECYRPEWQRVERRIVGLKPRRLDTVANVSDGNHISIAEHFQESGIRYLKGGEVAEVFIDDSEPTFIPESVYASIRRAHVSPGDVLVSIIGSVGAVALVTKQYERLSCSCKLGILRPFGIRGSVLAAYLLSKTGQSLLLRRSRGSVQQGVILPDLRRFPVPTFSQFLSVEVERLFSEAADAKRRADALYPEAESEILSRIDWEELRQRPVELSYTRPFKDIQQAGRADAEFLQPQYQRLRRRLQRSSAPLGFLVRQFDKGTQPSEYTTNGEVTVVKSKQVTGRGVSLETCERTTLPAWEDKSARLVAGDLLLNSTGRGTLGRAAVVPNHDGKAVAAVDLVIARLDTDKILSEYAAVFMNSPPGRAQSEQFQTGSSGQLHLYPDHFAQFLIYLPRLSDGAFDLAWQQRIVSKVDQARKSVIAAREKLKQAINMVDEELGTM